MKVLLVGEYSGLHKNIKEGLEELGYDTTIISYGDAWKKIESDRVVSTKYKGILGVIIKRIKMSIELFKAKDYDVVQLINPRILPELIGLFILKSLKRKNKKLFLLAAGDDLEYIKQGPKFRYWPYMGIPEEKLDYNSWWDKKIHEEILKTIDGIIPIMYDYAEGYRHYKKTKKTIPIPMNINKITYTPNIVKDKIIIFHGLNREEFKGTEYIRQAMESIKRKYPEEVQIIIDGKMPLDIYLETIRKTNIIIDQCKSYSYAMNAIYSMAQGKVVLSGAEPECLKELELKECPVINITPSVQDIESKLEYLIKNKNLIPKMGEQSRKFIEEVHDYKKVIKSYLETWKESN